MKRIIERLLPGDEGSATTRFFLAAALWLVFGTSLGAITSTHMIAPDILPSVPPLSFGRIRPTHVNIVIFGFLLNAFFGALLYIVPAVCRTRLFGEPIANLAVWIYNLTIVGFAVTLLMGITQGREYAEAHWALDILVLLSFAVLILLVFVTVVRRKENLIYVAVWYIGAGLVWSFFVYGTGNVVWDVPRGSWTGMNDQILMWFYGHNVVGLVITPQAVALAYYVLPRATRGPLYSHTLSLFGFWALIVMYTHTGTHHLLQTPAPEWLKVISIVDSVGLLIPVFAFLANIWLPLRDRFGHLYRDVGAKMVFTGTVWYFITCLQGPFQSLPSVQQITHYTQWTVGHAHIALLGFSGFIAMGGVYFILPTVSRRKLFSPWLADAHFWLHLLGTLGIFLSLTFAGLIQGDAWRHGEVVYRTLPMIKNHLAVRGISGTLVIVGALIFAYNVFRTVYSPREIVEAERDMPTLDKEAP